MLAFLKYSFLVALIGVTCLVCLGLYFVKFDSESFVGRQIREVIRQQPLIRRAVKVNQVGDAQLEYLEPDNKPIQVRVFYSIENPPHAQVQAWLEAMVLATTKESAVVTLKPNSHWKQLTEYQDSDLDKELLAIKHEPTDSTYLDVIYLTRYAERPTNVGLVIESNTIFIFGDVLKDLTSKPLIQARVEQSTLMHEWGHLLGLEHIEKDKCIMSARVDVYEEKNHQEDNIPTEYCFEDLNQLATRTN